MQKLIQVGNGVGRFFWRRAFGQREALGLALGCGLSFSLYALAQLWPSLPAFIIGVFVGPLVTALVAQRRVLLWGALTNSLLLLYCWLFPVFLFRASFSQVLDSFLRVVLSQGWFPYVTALVGVQVISLFTTVPVLLWRSSRLEAKSSPQKLF